MQSLRHWSLRAWFLHCYLIATLFLPPFPVTRAYWTDTDHSGSRVEVENPTSGDIWWGADSDGDLLTNEQEVYFGSDPYSLDSDRDGLTDYVEFGYSQAALDAGGPLPYDPWLWDTDGDGYSDFDECYQQINGYQPVVNYLSMPGGSTWSAGTFYTYSDADGDGVINPEDSDPLNMDRDGDGIYNWNEQPGCMDDASNGYTPPLPDNDPGVYIGGAWYPSGTLDSDNDGIPDQMDPFPWGSYTYNNIEYAGSWVDGDGDGIPDPADVYADDPTNGTGFYYDGVWYYNATWTDADYDGIPDPADFYPGDPTNGNGYNYNGCWYSGSWADADSDGIPDPADAFPNDSNNGASTETGYTYNGVWYVGTWIDSDGDGIPDPLDSYPSDPNNGSYYFNGNWYSGTWTDSDGDSIPDPADNYPLDPFNGTSDPTASTGYSYNGVWYYGNWLDSDGDGIPDPADGAPNDPYNGMGYSYNGNWYPGTWTDSDNDNIPDPADAYPTDPNNNFGFWYEGSWYFGSWADSDNDGIPDQADNYPYDANNGGYYYGGTWYSGSWADADNDGIPDPADGYPFDQYNGGYVYQGIWYPGPWSDYDNDDIPDAADNWSADPENGADNDYDGLTNYEERTQYGTDPDNVDTDGDGLTDFEEIHNWHTNPLLQKTDPNQVYTDYYLVDQTDTDGDGIPDRIEQWYASQGYGMSMNDPADAAGDLDADGYSNLQAYRNGWSLIADLDHYDDDGDGILDVLEDAWSAKYPGILSKTNSNDAVQDFDGDGLMNFEEIYLGIDPGRAGTFGSGITDMQYWIWCTITSLAPPSLTLSGMTTTTSPQSSWLEMADADHDGAADGLQALAAALSADPTLITVPSRATSTDYDGDGMPDLWEYQNHLDLRDPGDAQANPDGDSMLNLQEYQQGRNPNVNDDPSLQITTLSLPDAVVNAGYSTSITASGGVPPYQFSVSNGALPDGFSLDISGSLSGMAAFVGSGSFTVQVTDCFGLSAEQSYTLNVRSDGTPPPGDDGGGGGGPWPLTLGTTSQQLMGKINVPYAVTLSATGGSGAPYTFTLTGDLPAGLSFNAAAGTITGTPVVAGGQEVTLSVKDSAGMEVSTDLQVMVNSDLAVADIADVTCVQGGQGSIQVSASQGTAPYGLSWSPGLLVTSGLFDYTSAEGEPPAATAVVTCRPTTVGDATLDLYVEDATGTRVKKSVRLHVLPAVQLPTPTLTTVVAGTGTQLTLGASGGAGVYTWSVASGSLPAGMHLSADGVLSGTPTGHEVARFTLQVTDATGSTAQQSYTVETLSADAAAAADDPASPPPTFTREVRTRSVSLAQSGGVNETNEDRYTSDDGERDELIGQGFATTENDKPSFRYKLWKRNSDNDPAGWTYTSGSEELMSPENVKSTIDAEGEGPALSKVMDGIDKAAFVAGQSSTDSVSAGTSRYKGFVVGSWTDVRMRSSKPVKEDTTFTFLLSTGSSSSASSSSASPDAPKTYRTVSVTIPKGRTQPLEGGDDSHGTIQLRPDMKVKTLMPVDLEVDSNNDGTIDGADIIVEDVEANGSIDKMGHHLQVNAFDYDADKVPDCIDGITKGGYLLAVAGGNSIAGDPQRHFSKLKMTLGLSRSEYEFMFEYSADNPNDISVSQGSNFGQKEHVGGAVENYDISAPSGSLRIWTKDADMSRKAESITASTAGDFVPANEWIAGDKMPVGDMFLEGVRPSVEWGGTKLNSRLGAKHLQAS